MHRLMLALLAGAALIPASAHAQVRTEPCTPQHSVAEYRAYARAVYRRPHISHKAQHRLVLLASCQHTPWAFRQVHRWHRRFLRERKARMCNQSNALACIIEANHKYGGDLWHQIRCARSESGLDPWKKNYGGSGATGVFQFMPGTFSATIRRMGLRAKSIVSARWNSYAGVWKTARDGFGEWTGAGC